MNFHGMVKKGLTTTAVAIAGVALSTAPASAATDAHGYASYEDCGILSCITIETAEGWFESNGDKWKVCDLFSDGHRAGASATWVSGGATHIYPVWATGGEGSCSSWYSKNIPEDTKVTFKIWDQDGANGSPKHMKRYTAYA